MVALACLVDETHGLSPCPWPGRPGSNRVLVSPSRPGLGGRARVGPWPAPWPVRPLGRGHRLGHRLGPERAGGDGLTRSALPGAKVIEEREAAGPEPLDG